MTNSKINNLTNARKNLKEQAASQKHNSRILRKMPAPAATSSEDIAFPVGLRVGSSAHRNPPPRSPVLPPSNNNRPQVTFSTSTLKSSQSAKSLTPPNSVRSKESFCLEPEHEKLRHSSSNISTDNENWPVKQVKSIQNACNASKPFVESGVMFLISLLFTLFTFQVVIETLSSGFLAFTE